MSLIYFNKYQSSKSSPIGFFDNFFEMNFLQEAKNIFLSKFPNPDDETDFWNRYPYDVDIANERFKVEYEIEEYIDEFEQPKTNVVVVEYTFESELKNLFKYEYEKSKKLLFEKYKHFTESADINSSPKNIKNLKEGIKDIRYKIINQLENLNKEQYSNEFSNQLKEPLRWLILFLYNRFASVLPDPKLDKTVLSVIQTEKSILEKLDLKILSTDTADKLFNLTDRSGEKIIVFKNPAEDLEKFRLFCQDECGKINSPIYISGNYGAAFYIIGKIAKKLGIQRSLIEKNRIFSFQRVPFTAALCYTETTRYPNLNKEWADLIDDAFRLCLV